jgi:hypothetical protein
MSDRVSVSGEILFSLFGEFLVASDIPAADEWSVLLESLRMETFSGNLAEKEYWIDIYRRRRDIAVDFNPSLARDLARVVNDLSRFDGENIGLIIISGHGYGHFVWISPDLSSIVSCFRSRDKRST